MARTGPVTKDTSTIALGLAQIRVGNSQAYIEQNGSVLLPANSIGALANTKYSGKVDYWKLESGFPMLEDLSLPIRESSSLECGFKELTSANLAMARGIDPQGAVLASAAIVGGHTTSGTMPTDATKPVTVVQTASHVVIDRWTAVVEDDGGANVTYSVYGEKYGKVLTSVSDAFAQTALHDTSMEYFTIPAGFFAGTWVANETVIFTTIAAAAAGNTNGDFSNAHGGSINLGGLKAPDYVRMEAVYTYPNGINHMYIIFPRANVTSSMEIDLQAENNATIPITFEAKRADSEVSGGDVAWNNAPLGRIYFD